MARMFAYLLCVVLLCLWVGFASAAVPSGYGYNAQFSGAPTGRASAAAACEDAREWRGGAGAPNSSEAFVSTLESVTTTAPTTGVCVIKIVRTADGTVFTNYNVNWSATAGVCPANSTFAGGSCSCNSGFVEDSTHSACVAAVSELQDFCQQNAARKNTFKQSGSAGPDASMPVASCYKPEPPFPGDDAVRGCQMTLGDGVMVPQDGIRRWSATGVMTGAVCEDATATDAAPKAVDDPCPSGFPGTVNGETRCIAAEPDKGIEGVKGTSQTNADGTKIDTKETTKCLGDRCTTTTNTTTTTASGSVSNSSTTKTEALADKCQKDPKNQVCQKTQGGAGSAVADTTCDINPSAVGCGGDGAAIGDLYAKKDKTVAQALTKAKDALQASPLGSSVAGFFNVSAGGSCPQTSANIPFLNKTIVIDAWCTNFAANMFGIVKAVLLMLATWMAFRVAIDN